MLNFFKKQKEGGEKKENLIKGVVYGLGGALIILIIILAIIFRGPIKDKFFSGGASSADPNKVNLRITIITQKDCAQCWDVNLFLDNLKNAGVNEIGRETLYTEDRQTKNLIEKYNITQVPTILLAGELDKNANLQSAWEQLGEIIDDVFVLRKIIPPYIDLATGELKGKVSATYLVDETCEECYQVEIHENVLKGYFMLTFQDVKKVDVNSEEGKALVEKYGITAVPTVLLNGEMSEYQGLDQFWQQFGSVADDGTYIFVNLEAVGTYKDLNTGRVVKVELPEAQTQ